MMPAASFLRLHILARSARDSDMPPCWFVEIRTNRHSSGVAGYRDLRWRARVAAPILHASSSRAANMITADRSARQL